MKDLPGRSEKGVRFYNLRALWYIIVYLSHQQTDISMTHIEVRVHAYTIGILQIHSKANRDEEIPVTTVYPIDVLRIQKRANRIKCQQRHWKK